MIGRGGETLQTLLKSIAIVKYAVKTAFISSFWLSKLIMNRFNVQRDIFK